MFSFSRENTSIIAKWWRNIDKEILFLFIFLFLLGLFFSFASTSSVAAVNMNKETYFFFIKHLIFVSISFFLLIIISLQNKGVALKADHIDDRSFVFKCSPVKLEKAFIRQWICKHWLDDEWCELYKGEKAGFYPDAKDFARQKIGQMRHANWLYNQKSVPHIYSQGKITAEKDSGNWSDVLTSVLKSV